MQIKNLERFGDKGWTWVQEVETDDGVKASEMRTDKRGEGLFMRKQDGTWSQAQGTHSLSLANCMNEGQAQFTIQGAYEARLRVEGLGPIVE